MNHLIVDLNITLDGHKLGFVQQTMNWLTKHQKGPEHTFHFLVNVPLDPPGGDFIKVHRIESPFDSNFENKTGLGKYQEQWSYIKLKASQLDVEQIVLMEFDIYQLAIGRDTTNHVSVSGIWFRPYFRQEAINKSIIKKALFQLKKWQKKTVFKVALRNKNLKKVFVLNDQLTINSINKEQGKRLFYLADPVFEYENITPISIKKRYGIHKEKSIFLIFGFMDNRKNIPNIIESLKLMPENVQEKCTLLLIGKTATNYGTTIQKALKDSNSNVQVIRNSNFVDNSEMEALFEQSDLVLRMNVNFFASSGIIGLAAKYNKPSLVSNYGIVADLTAEYRLGKLADPMNVQAISDLLADFIENKVDWKINGQAYYREHDTAAFVKTLLSLD